jgi:TetR/AcrR family transcriptional regulator
MVESGEVTRRGPGRPRRSEEETAKVRRRIVDAAERTFAREGYNGVTATRVIEEAGLTRTNFYRYFRNSDEPLRIVFERVTADLHRRIADSIGATPHGPERVVAGIDAYLAWSCRHRHLLPAMTADLHDPASPVSGLRKESLEAVVALLAQDYADAEWPVPSRTTLDILVNAIEYTCYRLFVDTQGTDEDVVRARRMMLRIATAVLAGDERWRCVAAALATPSPASAPGSRPGPDESDEGTPGAS